MFSIKDGKVVATFGEGDAVTLALKDVKVDRDMLALTALQRVSRETVAGLATENPAKAKEKLLARWKLWQEGRWEAERAKVAKLSESEIHEIALSVLEYRFKAAKLPAADIARAKKLIAEKDATATAKFEKFCKENAKHIKQRIAETLKARKEADQLKY